MIGTELLDNPHADPVAVGEQLRDIARLNALFGGTRAVVRELESFFAQGTRDGGLGTSTTWTLLDVGTGLGDIPRAAAAVARKYGIALRLLGIEVNRTAARLARGSLSMILADGGALPLAPRSVDVIVASQVLHHLPRRAAVRWIGNLDSLARRAVVLADLRRSRVAMAGVWAASLGLAMSGRTRRDAVVSLRRGYTRDEFEGMLREAGIRAAARYRPGFRVVASWSPEHSVESS